jgi:hypothetical protein
MNPCDGNHPGREARVGKPWTPDQCRVCWLYHNDPAYRHAWGGPPEPPGALKQAANFLGAVIQHGLAGLPRASAEDTERRLAICRTCDFLVQGRCGKCGCPVAAKAAWAEQTCPAEKW